jgi:hypothetical protein
MPYIGAMGQYDNEPYAMYVHGSFPFCRTKLIARIRFQQDYETYEEQEPRGSPKSLHHRLAG